MIEILKMEVKNFSDLPPALQDTIMRKWRCTCDANEYDKVIISSKQVDVYYVCRKCGLVKKSMENVAEGKIPLDK